MKPFSEIENNMNGALVIPKLICIKFYCIFFERAIAEMDKKSPHCFHIAGRERSAEGFEGFYSLEMRGDIFKLVGLFFIPDNFIVMMQQLSRTVAVERLIIT